MARIVLVVDDSPVARRAVTRKLAERGVAFREADSMKSAVALASHDAACALLDFDLGDGTGLAVAEHYRRGNATFPVAFFTSAPDDPAVGPARALGPIFEKPRELDAALAWITAASG